MQSSDWPEEAALQSVQTNTTSPVTNFLKGVLIEKNSQLWKNLITNSFCNQMLNTKKGDTDYAKMNGHFRWYMVQDLLFLENNVRLKLSGDLRNAPWSEIVADKDLPPSIRSSIDYVENFHKTTLIGQLSIPDKTIQAAKPSPTLQAYFDYLNTVDKSGDQFALNCAKAACAVSYEYIANAAADSPNKGKCTLFYDAWVEPNHGYGSIDKYTKLLDQNQPADINKQLDHYASIFKGGVQDEYNFWGAALDKNNTL